MLQLDTGNVHILRVEVRPGIVTRGTGKDDLLGPHLARLLDVVLGQRGHPLPHPGDVERVAAAPFVAAQRGEFDVRLLHHLHERLRDGVDAGIK